MFVRKAHIGSVVPNAAAKELDEVPGVDPDPLSVRKRRYPAKSRRGIGSLEEQLGCLASLEALKSIGRALVKLLKAHANAGLRVVSDFIHALHDAHGGYERRRVVVDAEKRLIPNTALLAELAGKVGRISLDHGTLSKDVEPDVDERKKLGMNRQILELVGHKTMAVVANGLNVHINGNALFWRRLRIDTQRENYRR